MKHFLLLLSFVLFGFSSFGNEPLSNAQIDKIVTENFLKRDLPVRYVAPILVRIDRDASKTDSTIIQNLIKR